MRKWLCKFLSPKSESKDSDKEVILESLEEGVISLNKESEIIFANYMASKMVAIPKRELNGKKLEALGEGLLFKKLNALLVECLKRETILTDSFSKDKIYYDLIAVPQREKKGAILILQDKSAHHKVMEVGKDFITNASHELKTPITIIKGFAETLQDMPELPREMVVEITNKIVKSCQRMDQLVKNLLTLADLENLPAVRFQECDLIALFESCQDFLLTAHPSARIAIEKKRSPIMVHADPDILELALLNLLENGVKYSSSPAEITVTIEEAGGKVKIAIRDKGIGIPQESLEHIFTRFYTVDKARSRRLGGAGLGLSIVKTIIEKHQGEISVTSQLGSGSTFWITLPSV